MSLLFETIKIQDGISYNLNYHNSRLNSSRKILLGLDNLLDLAEVIKVPKKYKCGIVKCRVSYEKDVENVEYLPYTFPKIYSLKLVMDDDVCYDHKYVDRIRLSELRLLKGDCDEILIVKGSKITDTSFTNIAFYDGNNWFTPANPLLKGTKRQKLIDENKLIEEEILIKDLPHFKKISLINAMLDLGSISNIVIK